MPERMWNGQPAIWFGGIRIRDENHRSIGRFLFGGERQAAFPALERLRPRRIAHAPANVSQE
jgi:hypothetical protein